jgi:hypothetical protein
MIRFRRGLATAKELSRKSGLTAVVGLALHGCAFFAVDNENHQSEPPTTITPTVRVYKYQITRVDDNSVIAAGCVAFDHGSEAPGSSIQVRVPLGTMYDISYRIGGADGEINDATDEQVFCDDQVVLRPLYGHVAPTCYLSSDPSKLELVGAAVLDSNGNPYSVPDGTAIINGYPGDIELFRLRSSTTGPVVLNRYSPCPPKVDGSQKPVGEQTLLTVLP